MKRIARIAGIAIALIAGGGAASAAERIDGPVVADTVRVIDGDTIEVRARIWLGQAIVVSARIRGIDAPEVKGRCLEERLMARAAASRLAEVAAPVLRLSNIENDKYAGRVVADIATVGGAELAAAMLATGLVRPYDGRERGNWCG